MSSLLVLSKMKQSHNSTIECIIVSNKHLTRKKLNHTKTQFIDNFSSLNILISFFFVEKFNRFHCKMFKIIEHYSL